MMMGFVPLAIICSSLHFLVALTGGISVAVLGLGYLLLAYYWRLARGSCSLPSIGGALIIMAFVSLFASRPLRHFDTGLYHVQSVKWCTTYPLVRGLANLHERLAFNSLWTSISAVVDFPRFEQGAFFPITCLLLSAFGWAAYVAISRIRRAPDRIPEMFLAACGCFWTWLVIAQSSLVILPSLSSDAPIYFTTFLCVYFLLRYCAERDQLDFFQALTIAGLAVTLKVSAAPLFAFLVLFAAIVWFRDGNGVAMKLRAWSPVIFTIGLLFGVWILRSVLMSGYLVFPISSTALTFLPWHLPVPMADQLVETLKAWARCPWVSPAIVLGSSLWMRGWLLHLFDEEISYTILAYGAFGGLMFFASAAAGLRKERLARFWPAAMLLLIGLIYWFLTAPDPRYGYGYLFAIAALVLSMGFASLLGDRPKLAVIVVASSALIPIVTITDISHFHLLGSPPMGKGRSSAKNTEQGTTVYVAEGDQRILNAQLPSTPYFRPGLLTQFDAQGRIVQFELREPVHTPYYGIR